jgi:hypothetical protein
MSEKFEKHALVSWKKKWESDEWYFSSYADGIERESIDDEGGIRVVVNLPDEISGYVEESRVKWARQQLLLERQKYLVAGIAGITKGLDVIQKLLEKENHK